MNELLRRFAHLGDEVQACLDTAQDHCAIKEMEFRRCIPFLSQARKNVDEMIEVGLQIINMENNENG